MVGSGPATLPPAVPSRRLATTSLASSAWPAARFKVAQCGSGSAPFILYADAQILSRPFLQISIEPSLSRRSGASLPAPTETYRTVVRWPLYNFGNSADPAARKRHGASHVGP